MEEGNTEEVHGDSQSGKKSFANSSSDEKVVQKVDDSTHVFYPEHEYGEKEDCEVREIESEMTHKIRLQRNQLKKVLTGLFLNAVKKKMTKQIRKVNCFN